MKITSKDLKRIIKEEISKALSEDNKSPPEKSLPIVDAERSRTSGAAYAVKNVMQEVNLVLNGEGPFTVRGYLDMVSKGADQNKAETAKFIINNIDRYWNEFLAKSIPNFFSIPDPYIKDPRLSQEKPLQPGQVP